MIDRLTEGVADGSVGTEQIKIWLMGDTFFPSFSSVPFRLCAEGELKGNQSSKSALNKFKGWRIIILYPLRLRGTLNV